MLRPAAATTKRPDGSYAPTFPNAIYHVQKRNLEIAQRPNARERASYLPEIYQTLLSDSRLRQIDGNQTLFAGIELFVSNGHTEAQQHVLVEDDRTCLFYGGDLIPMTSYVPIPWIMGYDLRPLVMLEEKEKILSKCKEKDLVIFYEHDPKVEASHVGLGKKDYAPGEAVEL